MSKNTLNKPLVGIKSERIGNLYVVEGEVPYSVAWQWQQRLVSDYKSANQKDSATVDTGSRQPPKHPAIKDSLLLLQHPPVYTLGQGADTRFLRFDPLVRRDIELHRIERGGEVTYHCPGQLVGYPILDLHHYQLDLHWYLRALEDVLIRTLGRYGLKGERIEGLTGVWLEGYKVAAIGIKVSRWITMHGFALNVCPDLAGFEDIVPCGLEGKQVGSLAQFIPEISFRSVQTSVTEEFEQVFQLRLAAAPLSDLNSMAE